MKLDINVVVVTDSCLHEVAQLFILLNKFKCSPSYLVSFPRILTLYSFLCFHGVSSCNLIVKNVFGRLSFIWFLCDVEFVLPCETF